MLKVQNLNFDKAFDFAHSFNFGSLHLEIKTGNIQGLMSETYI